jgi:vancomycin resistance protein YoaR
MSHQPTKQPKAKATKPAPETKIRRKLSRAQWIFVTVAAVVIVLGTAATTYAFHYNNRYLPRTVVGGVAIGGMTQDQAAAALKAKQDQFLDAPLTLAYQDKTWELKPSELGTTVTAQPALDQLWKAEKTGGTWEELKKAFTAPLSTRYADATIVPLSTDGMKVLQDKVLSTIESAMEETSLTFSTREVAIVPGKPGEKLHTAVFEDAVASSFAHPAPITLELTPANPEVTPEMAQTAKERGTALLSKPLVVQLSDQTFSVDPTTLASMLYTVVDRDANGGATGLALNLSAKFTDQMHEWESKVNKSPVNARLAVDANGAASVVQDAVSGSQVDETQTIKLVTDYLNGTSTSGTVKGSFTTKEADVRRENFASLGLTQLVGTNTTDYSGSPGNRIINIKKGAASINQVLIKPGETFSTLGTLGPIDTDHGYVNELVIKGNRTVPDAGGGLCQVSTTLFRSVLNAGLPIVERQNHAYRVSYYERGTGPGLDATIFEPAPDFKWKNDYASSLFIQSHIEGTKITFDIYGTKEGREVDITPPTILETYPVGDPIYANTDTLPAGVTKQVETAHAGAKTSVTYTVKKNGQQTYSKTFISVYKAWNAQFLVGTGAAPEPTPTPTP